MFPVSPNRFVPFPFPAIRFSRLSLNNTFRRKCARLPFSQFLPAIISPVDLSPEIAMSIQTPCTVSDRFFPPGRKASVLSAVLACLFGALPAAAPAAGVLVNTPVSTPVIAGDGETVTISETGSLTLSGENRDAIQTGGNATVTNHGKVTTAGNGSNAIQTGSGSTVVNNGILSTTGTYTGSSLADAHFSDGMLAGAGSRLVNNGAVTTSGDSAYAVYAMEGSLIVNSQNARVSTSGKNANGLMGENGVTIANHGKVTTSGDGSYGMRGKDHAVLVNTGTVETGGSYVLADPFDGRTNTATAMQGGDNARLTNTGVLHTTGESASGMAAGRESTLYNAATGVITVEGALAQNGGAYIFADGMMGGENATLVNDGVVRTGGASIFGLFGNTGSTLANNGTVETSGERSVGMLGENGTRLANTGIIRTAGDGASGMTGKTGSSVVNGGLIETSGGIVATNPINGYTNYASGITIEGDNATVVNTGSILTSGEQAHGIYLAGRGTAVSSTGFIASKSGAELYVGGKTPSDAASATVTAWATEAGKNGVFRVENNATLTFDRARLILRAPADGITGKTYRFADMADTSRGGTINGSIASVSSVMPMLSVQSSGNTPDTLKYRMRVDAVRSYGQQASVAAVRNAQNRFWLSNRTIAAALTGLYASSSSEWSAFGQSYSLNAGASGNAPSSSDSVGLILGATRRIGQNGLAGFHAGIETTDMNAHESGVSSDSTSWLLGLHGSVNVSPAAFLRGQLTGMVSRSDYDFSMMDDTASDKRTEYAFFANVTGGYDVKVNEAHTITPEIGLAYLYMKNPSMDANWSAAGNRYMDVHVDSDSYQAVFATATLRWTGTFGGPLTSVKPTVALGVRQTLTDGEIDGGMRFVGNRYGSYVADDKTVGTVEAGLQFQQGNMTMAVKYNGNFGQDTHDSVVWGEIGYAF